MKRGRNSPAYFSSHVTVESVFTNTATGAYFTTREVSHFKDLHVTDNGDGTLTAVNFGTGFAMMFDPDGRIVGKDTGQTRWESIIDLNGTPDDFDDDKLVSRTSSSAPPGPTVTSRNRGRRADGLSQGEPLQTCRGRDPASRPSTNQREPALRSPLA